jgi:hypothetical protein
MLNTFNVNSLKKNDATRMFKVSTKTFEVMIKLPVNQGKDFIKLSKCKTPQFPLNNDLLQQDINYKE